MEVGPQGLLERDAELRELGKGLDAVRAGEGALVLVEGPAGIGKTTLLTKLRQQAASGDVPTLAARGGELERDFAFAVVRQLFEPILARASPSRRQRLLSGAAALASPLFGLGNSGRSGPGDPTYPTLHGLYWLLANLAAEAPLLITVDDAHFADLPSLGFLAFLGPRLEGLAVLVALAVRSGEPTQGEALLAQLAADPSARVIRPLPLSRAAVAELVRNSIGPAATSELCRSCHHATGGNPFLVRELLGELTASDRAAVVTPDDVATLGPETVARAVLVRLGRLPPAAVELAKTLVVLGDGAELRQLAELADLPLAEAESAADALAQADIITPGRPLGFVHPIVRTAIDAELEAGERTQAHKRAARLLATDGAEPPELAPHLIASEPARDPWVVATLRQAADWAGERGSLEIASACLARALREPPAPEERSAVLLELGTVEVRLGLADASDHIRRALAAGGDGSGRAAASAELAVALLRDDRWREAIEVLEQGIAELDDRDTELRLPLERQLIAFSMFDPGLRPAVGDRLGALRSQVGDEGNGGRALLALAAMDRMLSGASAAEVSALGERALAGGELLEYVGVEGIEFHFLAIALVVAERYDLAAANFTLALSKARTEGSAFGFALTSCFRAFQLLRTGSLNEAEGDARASLDLVPYGSWRPMAFATLIETLIERGEFGVARAELVRAETEGWPDGNLRLNLPGHSRGLLLLAEGELEAGLEQLLEVGRRQTEWGVWNPSFLPWRSEAALALLSRGDGGLASELAGEEVEYARIVSAPRALGVALRAKGLIEGGEFGLELLGEAVAVLATSQAPLEHARALIDLGAALRLAGRSKEAQDSLRLGLDLAHRCGATPLEERARQELRALGVRPRRPALSGPDSLTPSELRVAEFVIRGLSNREVAQALFVTEKTVEAHLGSAYRKLDIHSRLQLARAFGPEEQPALGGEGPAKR